jgi:hypothetical protein
MVYSTTDWLSWLIVFLGRFEHILRGIRNGVTYPDRWPEGEDEDEVVEEDENAAAPTRWWEQEGLTLEQALKGGRG